MHTYAGLVTSKDVRTGSACNMTSHALISHILVYKGRTWDTKMPLLHLLNGENLHVDVGRSCHKSRGVFVGNGCRGRWDQSSSIRSSATSLKPPTSAETVAIMECNLVNMDVTNASLRHTCRVMLAASWCNPHAVIAVDGGGQLPLVCSGRLWPIEVRGIVVSWCDFCEGGQWSMTVEVQEPLICTLLWSDGMSGEVWGRLSGCLLVLSRRRVNLNGRQTDIYIDPSCVKWIKCSCSPL